MITEKKVSNSTNCLQAINRSTCIIFPSITNKTTDPSEKTYKQPIPLAKSPNPKLIPPNDSQHNRNLTPFNGNKSYSYLYSITLQDIKTKDPSPSSLIKILKPEMYPKYKMAGKKLELVGRTVVSTNKVAPKNKFSLPQAQGSNEYIRKLANVKSKYFCYVSDKRKTDKKIRIRNANVGKVLEDSIIREKSAQRDERDLLDGIKKEKFINNRAIGLTAWEQDFE